MLLAPAARGADLITSVGWLGPVNKTNRMAPMSAMLRSWEDRFGALVVGVGFDTLQLSVAAPPITSEHAQQVAAEHWAFCADNIQQGSGSLTAYAEEIQEAYCWSFWWD